MDKELYKVLYSMKSAPEMRVFIFTDFSDDPQNGRVIFIHDDLDKVLTLYYDDISRMITAPFEP